MIGIPWVTFYSVDVPFLKNFFLKFTSIIFDHSSTCEILVLQLGIEPAPSALEVQCLTHWTTRKSLMVSFNAPKFYILMKSH